VEDGQGAETFLVIARNDGDPGAHLTCHVRWFRQGKKTSPPLREDDRVDQREAFPSQTCPVETAVDTPCPEIKEIENGIQAGRFNIDGATAAHVSAIAL